MSGSMMIRLMMRMMIFFWICYFNDSPNLKFSLLLFIFYFDSFFSCCSFQISSCHFRYSSIAFIGSTLIRCKGYSLKVCSRRSTMLVISKVFLALERLLLPFSDILAILDLFLPRRRKLEPPVLLILDLVVRLILSVLFSQDSLLLSEIRYSEIGSNLLFSSTFFGRSCTNSVLVISSSSLSISDFILLSMKVSVLNCDQPLTDSVFLAYFTFFSSYYRCLFLKKAMKMSRILAALPPILESRLAFTTLARVSTAGSELLSASQLSTQVISMTMEMVETTSIQKQKESKQRCLMSPLSTISRAKMEITTIWMYPKMQAVGWFDRDFTKSMAKMEQTVIKAMKKLQVSLLAKSAIFCMEMGVLLGSLWMRLLKQPKLASARLPPWIHRRMASSFSDAQSNV